jgi:hypothetical protein
MVRMDAPRWADHNVHVPGITLLQVLVYTLGVIAFVAVSAAALRSTRRWGDRDPD